MSPTLRLMTCLLSCTIAVLTVRAAGQSSNPETSPASDPAPTTHLTKAALFADKGCSYCHQINGVGGHKGPDLTHVGKMLPSAKIEQQILKGSNEMPAYGEVLTPEETKSLLDYLHKLR